MCCFFAADCVRLGALLLAVVLQQDPSTLEIGDAQNLRSTGRPVSATATNHDRTMPMLSRLALPWAKMSLAPGSDQCLGSRWDLLQTCPQQLFPDAQSVNPLDGTVAWNEESLSGVLLCHSPFVALHQRNKGPTPAFGCPVELSTTRSNHHIIVWSHPDPGLSSSKARCILSMSLRCSETRSLCLWNYHVQTCSLVRCFTTFFRNQASPLP